MEGWHDDYMLNGLTAEILRFLSGGICSRPDRAERLGLHAQVLYCGRVCPGSQVHQIEQRDWAYIHRNFIVEGSAPVAKWTRERAERLGLHAQVLYCGRVCPGSQADQREQRDWAYMHRYFIVEGSAPVAKCTK